MSGSTTTSLGRRHLHGKVGNHEAPASHASRHPCRITTTRNKKTKTVTKRTYMCTVRLRKGTWTITTTARGKAGVVAESTRRVVVR